MIIAVFILVAGGIIGYWLGLDGVPKSCAEIGEQYLRIKRERLGISDYESAAWDRLIEEETDIVNNCYNE